MDELRRDPTQELSGLMKETSVTAKADDPQIAEKKQDDVFHRKLFVGNIGYQVCEC